MKDNESKSVDMRNKRAGKAKDTRRKPNVPAYCYEDDGFLSAIRIMAQKEVKRLLVLSRNHSAVGYIAVGNGSLVFERFPQQRQASI